MNQGDVTTAPASMSPDRRPPSDTGTDTSGRRLTSVALRSSAFWMILVLLVEVSIFSLALPSHTFLSTFNAQTLAADCSILLILAAGQTFVMIAGGIDLSVGSLMTLASVVAGLVMQSAGGSDTSAIMLALATGVGVAAAWGCLNGLLIVVLKVPDFIVTLGSLGAALGAARLLSEGQNVGVTSALSEIGQGMVLGIPVPFLIGAATMLVLGILLHQTRFGEHTFLIGSNNEAARRGGIRVNRHVIVVYTMSGLLAGFAGMVDLARLETASVATGHATELLATIAAVVIGGASLFGGGGAMAGTAVGVFIPVVLANGLLIGGIPRYWQDVIIGLILVAAVALDRWRRDQELRGR